MAEESAQTTTPPAASSFLDGIKKESPPSAPPTSPSTSSTSPSNPDQWMWDEGMPGNGPRPDWVKPKYKSVAEQAKAYPELEKQLGQLGSAPDNYDLTDFQDKLKTDNPSLQKFMETAKKSRLGQDTFKEMLGTLVEYEQSLLPNSDIETAKLGPNANQTIETVRQWAANNLSQEACDVLGKIGNRADVIKFVDELRQVTLNARSQPPGTTHPGEGFKVYTLEDWNAELKVPSNAKRYTEDSKYRTEMQQKLKIIYGED